MLRDSAEQQNEAFLIPPIKRDLVIRSGINQGLSSKRLGATLRKPRHTSPAPAKMIGSKHSSMGYGSV